MKLALIPPPANADWMYVTNYQLILPSFLEAAPTYRNTVRGCRERGDYIILDNGVAEGLGIDNEVQLYNLAKAFQVDEVVIPDVYGDCDSTLQRLGAWKINEEYKHMAVLAATTPDEVKKMLDVYCETALIDTIGIPRLLWDHGISRSWVAGLLHQFVETTGLEVHLLGMNSSALAEMHFFPLPGVRGVDTSAPFVYAAKGHLWIANAPFPDVPRDAKYIDIDLDSSAPPSWAGQPRKQMTANDLAKHNVNFLMEKVYGTPTP